MTEGTVQQNEFELNDPDLMTYVPEDFDPNAEPIDRALPPPPEGEQWVQMKLRDDQEGKPAVYAKAYHGGVKVMARLVPRLVYQDGTIGQFLKDFYPSNCLNFDGQPVADLVYIMRLAGTPLILKQTTGKIIEHVRASFEAAGDQGVLVPAYVRWLLSSPAIGSDGSHLTDGNGKTIYNEIKGKKAIIASIVAAGGDPNKAHLYVDASGTERSIRSEVARLLRTDAMSWVPTRVS